MKRSSLARMLVGAIIFLVLGTMTPVAAGNWPTISKDVSKTVLVGVNIVSVDDGQILTGYSVFLENGKISKITNTTSNTDVSGYQVIDMTGKYLMPGLIDMHTHILDRADLAQYLSYGVTSVRNMLGLNMHLRWKRKISNGKFIGCRMITASPTLNSGDDLGPFHKNLKKSEKIPALIEKMKNQGYDFLKVYDGITQEQFEVIEKSARSNNMYFAGHPPVNVDRSELLSSDLRSFEHIEEVFNTYMNRKINDSLTHAIAKEFANNQMPMSVTLSAYHHLYRATVEGKELWDVSPKNAISPMARFIGKRQTSYNIKADDDFKSRVKIKDEYLGKMTKIFFEEGVPLLLSTDTGPNLTVPGETLHDEIDLWEKYGIPAHEILKAGTSRAAQVLGMEDQIGLVKEGYLAELVILNENPLENLKTLREPHAIVFGKDLYLGAEISELRQLAYRKKVSWIRTLGNFIF